VAPDADGGGDAHAGLHHLVGGLIGEGAALAHNAHGALLEHEAGHDTHLAFIGRDPTGAGGSDQGAVVCADVLAGRHHVLHGDALGDAYDHLDAGGGGLHDGIGGERGRHEDDAHVSAGGLHGIAHGLEHRPVQVLLPALAGGHPAHHVRTILDHLRGVEGSFAASEALNDDLALLVDEYAHGSLGAGFAAANVTGRPATAGDRCSSSGSVQPKGDLFAGGITGQGVLGRTLLIGGGHLAFEALHGAFL